LVQATTHGNPAIDAFVVGGEPDVAAKRDFDG